MTKKTQPVRFTRLQVHIVDAMQLGGFGAEWHSIDWWAGYLEHLHGSQAVLKRSIGELTKRGVVVNQPPLYRLAKEWRV